MDRRDFIKKSCKVSAALGLVTLGGTPMCSKAKAPLFKISLAEWSFHRAIFAKDMDHLDFAKVAKTDYNIDGLEYVNQFFFEKAKDSAYLKDMKDRADSHGVKSLLIMCDGEGYLGDPDDQKRTVAVENHYKWVEAAKYLGCHSIRVNARSDGSYEEQQKLAADGLARLTEFGAQQNINVIVENHGGLSSNGQWLTSVLKMVNHPMCGTLPDFGNFRIKEGEMYDRYKGVEEMMPFAKGVSAKSHDFDAAGEETQTDYTRMLKIVLDAGYRGYVGIEYEGGNLSEAEGVQKTKELLEAVRTKLAQDYV